MEYVGQHDVDNSGIIKELNEQKIEAQMNLSEKLIDGAIDIINQVISSERDRDALRSILLLRHPSTGIQPSVHEIEQFLCDLPGYVLTVHRQYLYAKREKERLLSILRPQATKLLVEERMRLKNEGTPLSIFGAITKDDIRDKLHILPDFPNLLKWEEEEETLNMIVKLLEARRYELSKILDVNIKAY